VTIYTTRLISPSGAKSRWRFSFGRTLTLFCLNLVPMGHVSSDPIHLLVSVPPDVAVSVLVQRLKGRSSRRLQEEFGELKRQYWGRHLWARGYFGVSTGNVTDEIIKQYIESHKDMPSPDDGDFQIDE
jgi:REP-associated tyrosine transposase